MTAFTVDAARSLPGPDWLRQRRVAAAERFAAAPLPTAEEEVWRYSRIAELDLDSYQPANGSGDGDEPAVPAPVAEVLAEIPERAATAVVVDGRVAHLDGTLVASLAAADGAEPVLGAAGDPPDVFAGLNDGFSLAPILVRVPAGATVDGPIVVVHWAGGDGLATFPRVVVDAGPDSAAVVVELYLSARGVVGLTAPVTELVVGRAARLGYVCVQDLGLTTWQLGTQVSRVDAEATLVSATASLGGDYARQRTDCRLIGRGATGTLLAIYFGEADQTLDFRTFQDHVAPDTTSRLLFKGAVAGRSRSVYTGLIHVGKEARGTNAFQTNRNIKLSEHAWAESVPNLEIENNDVRCSHASAVGPIDEEQRFYLESRGIPPAVTERLVVSGFFDEVLEQLPAPAVVPSLRAAVAGKLDRRDDD